MWPENPKKHHVEIIVLALTLRIKCFSCNLIYPKSSRLKKRASRKHFEASVEKREPRGTFLSLGLRPRLQKPFPRFPFFYLGFKNLLLAALYFTLDNLGKIKLHLKHFSWELPEQLFQQSTIYILGKRIENGFLVVEKNCQLLKSHFLSISQANMCFVLA